VRWGGEALVMRGGGASYREGGDGSPNEWGDDNDRRGGGAARWHLSMVTFRRCPMIANANTVWTMARGTKL
jgi:hypothetical protein